MMSTKADNEAPAPVPRSRLWPGAAGVAVLVGMVAGIAGAQTITEFPVPTPESGPFAIAAGPDGNLWFTSIIGHVGRITPGGVVTEFSIPTAGSQPEAIVAGPDGNLWFTEFEGNQIGRITTTGVITEFSIPRPDSRPAGIAAGPDGNLWFAEDEANQIGRITAAGVITQFPIPTGGSHPQSLAAGPDGNLWFTEEGANQIGRITTAGVITEFPIPTADSGALGITAGPDANLWFTELNANQIGRITAAGAITEFSIPTAGSGPAGIAVGADGSLWFAEVTANQVGRITTAGVVTESPITTASSAPAFIVAGPDAALWFTEYSGNQIGRITTGPCTPEKTTLCLSGARFRVSASWRSATQSGQGTAVPLSGDTGTFWFFNPDNVEILVKVLAGCGINGHEWIFAGGLTDIEVTLTVTDTQTGEIKTYVNPAGTAFQPIQDTAAFSSCPASLSASFAATYGIPGNAAPSASASAVLRAQADPCTADPTTLCLSGGRFQVQAAWRSPSQGTSGQGGAVSLTPDTGTFWFFGAANVEVIVKVLDACSLNAHEWVFAAGLTDVEVTLTVTDTQTGAVQTYVNPAGTAFQPIQDTAAFATCLFTVREEISVP